MVPGQLWIGRRSVGLLARTDLGACRIMPPAGDSRHNHHHRRKQRDEQEDPCGHDPHLQHLTLLCRLNAEKGSRILFGSQICTKTPSSSASQVGRASAGPLCSQLGVSPDQQNLIQGSGPPRFLEPEKGLGTRSVRFSGAFGKFLVGRASHQDDPSVRIGTRFFNSAMRRALVPAPDGLVGFCVEKVLLC